MGNIQYWVCLSCTIHSSAEKTLNPTLCPCRKFCFGDSKVQKSRGKGPKFSPQKPECGATPPYQRELRSKETPEKMVLGRSGPDKDPLLPCKEESELSAQMEELPFMSTTEMYLCRWHQPPPSPLRESSPKKEEDVASECTRYTFLFFIIR